MSHRHHKHRGSLFTTKTSLIIPPDKPEIEFLLRVTATPKIEQTIVRYKQISLSGHVTIFVEYVASVPDGAQPITFVQFRLPVEGELRYRHATAGRNARLKCNINIPSIEPVDPRNITASVNLRITGVKISRHSLPPHLCKPYHINFFENNSYPKSLSRKAGSEY